MTPGQGNDRAAGYQRANEFVGLVLNIGLSSAVLVAAFAVVYALWCWVLASWGGL